MVRPKSSTNGLRSKWLHTLSRNVFIILSLRSVFVDRIFVLCGESHRDFFFITMGYPENIKAVTRKLNKDVVTTSCPFAVLDYVHVGARMALINCDDKIVIWCPLPWGDHYLEALQLLTGKNSTDVNDYNVTHIIISNFQHCIGIRTTKPQFPQAKVVATHRLEDHVDYKLTTDIGNKVLTLPEIAEANGGSESGFENLQFVYLNKHKNKDVVMFDARYKIMFESDVLFTIGNKQPNGLEQYSAATGFEDGHNPHKGLSLVAALYYPQGWFYRWTQRRLLNVKDPDGLAGCKAFCNWDIKTIVPSHGNVIEEDGGKIMKEVIGI